jgi:metallo-beta-lactamase family protein
MQLTFLGGAGTVTGSKFAIAHDGHRLLIDCGLFHGFKSLRLKNWAPFPIAPQAIDAVVLTHAHLDHSGALPLLIKYGFKGKIFCSTAPPDLCSILLPDSGHLQEKDADFANRHGFSKHKPALPLYTEEDGRTAADRLTPIPFGYDQKLPGGAGFRLRLRLFDGEP